MTLSSEDKIAMKKLQTALKQTPLNKEEQFGLAFCLCASDRNNLQKHCNKMSKFLEENPNASYDEIQDQAYIILGIDLPEEDEED